MVAEAGSKEYKLGVFLALVSCVLFAVVYFIPALLTALPPMELFSWRIVVTVPLLALVLVVSRSWSLVVAATKTLRSTPHYLIPLLINAAILFVQLWLFTWAPQVGRGMEVALGYFLLPLTMVLVGVLIYKEYLSRLRIIAVLAAAIGVASTLLFDAAVSWPTFVVCLGYPLYFILRKQTGLNTIGALLLELSVLLPLTMFFAFKPSTLQIFDTQSLLLISVILFGVLAMLAQTAYIFASRLLPFNLFGLLTYTEPVLLLVVSLAFLGGTIVPGEYLLYTGIVIALLCLGLEALKRPRI